MNTEQNYSGEGVSTTPNEPTATPIPQTAQIEAQTTPAADNWQATIPQTPFQAALLFMAAKQDSKPGFSAFVCYLNRQQVIGIERLHSLRGPNPQVNLTSATSRIRKDKAITGIILATWVHSTSEYPYAEEFADEVYRQYDVLSEAGIKLIDNLRLSETGVYSYYGEHNGPYSTSPNVHAKGICRLY